jgi:hypothetical protein
MSRFTGPQHRGANRKLADTRRREAETRQAAERKREARRAARDAAAPRPLTDDERAELIEAARKVALAQWLFELGYPWPGAAIRARENRTA